MKKFAIGEYAYPVDNSYSYTIGEEKKGAYGPLLAGTVNTPAKKVLIISYPYKMIVLNLGEYREYKFRTVFYDGKCHVYLNNFRKEL